MIRAELRRRARRRIRALFRLEELELRCLLSAAPLQAPLPISLDGVTATPAIQFSGRGGGGGGQKPTNQAPVGLTPAQVSKAYAFDQLSGNGSGQTIAIVDAYNNPNISSDLSKFDQQFGLPAASLSVVSQTGSNALPKNDSGWGLEESLDVQWAHAMAPAAKLLLVEAKSASLSDLLTAVSYASSTPGVSVVSMSWGTTEFSGQKASDSAFTTPSGHAGVTFVAASGDDGGASGPSWPASSPNVLSVGGTTLKLGSDGSYMSETGWAGSSGGTSAFETEPSYQTVVQNTGARVTPDVAFNADPNTGFAVYDSSGYNGQSGWFQVGGTSAGAPQWAGLVSIANQLSKSGPLDGVSQTLPRLYSQASSSSSTASSFHDVTSGSNANFTATAGFDAVTGLGTPVASSIVNILAGTSSSASPQTQTIVSAPVQQSLSKAVPVGNQAPLAPTGPQAPQSPTAPKAPEAPQAPNRHTFATAPAPSPVSVQLVQIFFVTQTTPNFVPLVTSVHNTTAAGSALSVTPATTSLVSASTSTQAARGQGPIASYWDFEFAPSRSRDDLQYIDPEQVPADPNAEPEETPGAPLPKDADGLPLTPALIRALESLDGAKSSDDKSAPAEKAPKAPQPPKEEREEKNKEQELDPESQFEAALTAGIAVALWGAWELRRDKADRRRGKKLTPA